MIKRLVNVIIGLIPLIALSACLYWIMMTPAGLRFIVEMIPEWVPGNLTINQVSGAISHEIHLQDISYQNDLVQFNAKRIDITWLPTQLINHNALTIPKLLIDNGHIQIKTNQAHPTNQWLHLPFNIALNQLTIQQFVINYDKQTFVINDAQLQGHYQSKNNYYQLNWQLAGESHHYPMQSHGSFSLTPQSITLPDFELRSIDSTVQAHGTLNTQWQGQWQLDIKNLQHFIPDSAGQLISNGTINGERSAPIIHTTIQANQLHYADYQINSLNSELIIDPAFQKPWQIQLSADGLHIKKYIIDKLLLSSQSTLDQQQIQLHLQQSNQQLALTIQGQLHNKIWLGQLQQFTLNTTQWGNWHLQQSSQIKLTPRSALISNTTLQSARDSISFNGAWQKQQSWSASLSANNFALQNLQFLLPNSLQLQGQLKLVVNANQNINQPITGQIQFNINNSTLHYPLNNQPQSLALQKGQATITLDKKGISSLWQFNLTPQQGFSANINLPSYQIGKPVLSQAIDGAIHVTPIPLSTIQKLIPDTKNLQGMINIDSTIAGTINKPIIIGQLKLQNGQVTIPALNITLNNLQINANGKPDSTIQYHASAASGDGQILLSGSTDLQKPGYLTVWQIQGKQFLAVNTPHYQIYASPQLTAQIQNRDIHLTGDIFIPQATLAPLDYKSQSVVLPDDVVFVNQAQPVNSTAFWNYYSQIQLDLGDKINVNVLGLQGQLLGHILLNDLPQRPTTASGSLLVKNGQYTAYGQTLNVDSGRLIFAGGPLINPGVSLQASRQVTTINTSNIMSTGVSNLPSTGNSTLSSVTTPFFSQATSTRVGIHVQGTLNDPQITLFADPASLSQADILSYLLLNQPSSQVSAAGAQLLVQAASSMNLGGGQVLQVTQQLQKTFGLTQLTVGTTNYYNHQTASMVQNTSLMVGKKITPNLYINYSVGLTAPINILQISYLLSSHWTLQSSTSSLANGIDLLYSFEHK